MLRPFTHVQSTPSDTWTIPHTAGRTPGVSTKVWEEGVLTEILPYKISYPDEFTVVIQFTTARTGEARII